MLKTDTTLCEAIFARYLNRTRPREHARLFHWMPGMPGGGEGGRPVPATTLIQNVWRIQNCFQQSALVSLRLNLSFLSGLIVPAAARAAEAVLRPLWMRAPTSRSTEAVRGRPGQSSKALSPHTAGPSAPASARTGMPGAPLTLPGPPAAANAPMATSGRPAVPLLSVLPPGGGKTALPAMAGPGSSGGAFRPADREHFRLLERSAALLSALHSASGFTGASPVATSFQSRPAGGGRSSAIPPSSAGRAGSLPDLREPRPFLPVNRLYQAEGRFLRPSTAVSASPAFAAASLGAYPGYARMPVRPGPTPAAQDGPGRKRRAFPSGESRPFRARSRQNTLIPDRAQSGSGAASFWTGGDALLMRHPAAEGPGMAELPPMRPQAVEQAVQQAGYKAAGARPPYRPAREVGHARGPLGAEPSSSASFIGNRLEAALRRHPKPGTGRLAGGIREAGPPRTARRGEDSRPSPGPQAQAAERGLPFAPAQGYARAALSARSADRAYAQPAPSARSASRSYARPVPSARSADRVYALPIPSARFVERTFARPAPSARFDAVPAPARAQRGTAFVRQAGMAHPAPSARFAPADGAHPGLSGAVKPPAMPARRREFAEAPMIQRPGPAGEEAPEQLGIPSVRIQRQDALPPPALPAAAWRQGEQAARAISEAVEQAVEDIHLGRIADRVYRVLENRLRQEKLRRGMWG